MNLEKTVQRFDRKTIGDGRLYIPSKIDIPEELYVFYETYPTNHLLITDNDSYGDNFEVFHVTVVRYKHSWQEGKYSYKYINTNEQILHHLNINEEQLDEEFLTVLAFPEYFEVWKTNALDDIVQSGRS